MAFWDSSIDGWIRWRTTRLAVTPLDRVVDGTRVKIAGRIDAGDGSPLEAPISARRCAGWSVEIEEWPSWEVMAVEQQVQDFVVHDGSGRAALVRAGGARVLFECDASSWPARPSARMLALLRRHRLREHGGFQSGSPYRFWEGALALGETITVVGVARLEIDPSGAAGSYREPPLRAVLSPTLRTPLWILDAQARGRRE